MSNASIPGGSSTSTSRTMTLYFYANTFVNEITIPISLATSTTAVKSVTITATYGEKTATITESYDTTETGDREVSLSIGFDVQVGSSITIRASGTRCYVNYGSYTMPYSLGNQIAVTSNPFSSMLNYDAQTVWSITNQNDGYPWNFQPPNEEKFQGYGISKPVNAWRIDSNNDGYPWIWGFSEIPPSQSPFYYVTETGLIPLTAYYVTETGLIQL